MTLLILKIEYEDEDYSNFTIPFNKSKRLKICTFKVIDKGKSIGEEFINIISREAINNNVNEIYVTIYDKHKSLIILLKKSGFYEYTSLGSNSNNKELVLLKRRNN